MSRAGNFRSIKQTPAAESMILNYTPGGSLRFTLRAAASAGRARGDSASRCAGRMVIARGFNGGAIPFQVTLMIIFIVTLIKFLLWLL
jgi:hypothetical protein